MRTLPILLLLVLSRLPVLADTCFTTFEGDSARADVIFIGKLYKISEDEFWHRGYSQTVFNFKIYESYKGLRQRQRYISVIGPGYDCCNVKFVEDSVYIVFAFGDGKDSRTYWTSDCSLTGLLSENKEIQERLWSPITPIGNDGEEDYLYRRDKNKEKNKRLISALKSQIENIELQNQILIYVIAFLLLVIIGLAIKIKKKNST